jgi:hypothetical protein
LTSRRIPNENSVDPTQVTPEELEQGIWLTHQGYDEAESSYGSFPRLIGFDEKGELRSLAVWHQALRSKVGKIRPKKSERVFFKKLGVRTSVSGRNYRDWTVRADRPLLDELPTCAEDEQLDDEFNGEPD